MRVEVGVAGPYRANGSHRVTPGLSPVDGRNDRARTTPSNGWRRAARVAPPVNGSTAPAELRVHIDSDRTIVDARRNARRLATTAGLRATDLAMVVAAVSELARNALLYAQGGELIVSLVQENGRQGVSVIATDNGPGIADVPQALQDGFSTSGRLGLGLPGVKRLMDDFEICSAPGMGTTVIARKWKR